MIFVSKKRIKDPNERKLSLGKFFAWKSSDVSAAWVNWIVNTYILFYCTDALGISAAVAGTILLATNIIDAVTDLLIGYVIDKSPVTKWGKVRPYELAIIGVTLCTAVLFMCPGGAPDIVKYLWIFFAYTMTFGIFNTMRYGANTPYLVRAFHNDRGLIGKVSAYGGLVTTMGAAIITFVFPRLMGAFAYATDVTATGSVYHLNTEGWTKLLLIFMIPATVIGLFRFLFVKEDPSIDSGKEKIPFNLGEVKRMLTKNVYVYGYALLIFAFNMIQNFGAMAYYFQYIVGDTGAVGTISLISYFLLPFMLVIPPLLKKFGATKIIWFTAIVSTLGYVLNLFAGANMALLTAAAILTALAVLPVSYLGNVILMQIFNFNEYKRIARQEATTTALSSSFASQLGQGFAPFVTGIVLELAHYDAALATQPASALTAIRILYSLAPALCMVAIFFGARFLGKLEKFSPEMEAELKERREPETPAPLAEAATK